MVKRREIQVALRMKTSEKELLRRVTRSVLIWLWCWSLGLSG
jgi:hypothetical protein